MVTMLLFAGCQGEKAVAVQLEEPEPALPSPPAVLVVDSSRLTGAALAAWNASGRFAHGAEPIGPLLSMLSPAQAEQAMRDLLRVFSGIVSAHLSDDRGERVEVSTLRPCGPPLLGETSFESPPDSIDPFDIVRLGPFYVFYLCDGAVQKAVVSVGAYATQMTSFPWDSAWSGAQAEVAGVALRWAGIAIGVRLPTTPEEAASRVAELTGRRVSGVPRLILGRPPRTALSPMWAVDIDSVIQVRGEKTGAVRARRTVLFGAASDARFEHALYDARGTLPSEIVFTTRVPQASGPPTRRNVVLLSRPLPVFDLLEKVVPR